MVENLLSNVSKYTPSGSRVTVSAREDGHDHVVVTVGDDGPGIPESEIARIGERYFRGSDVQTRTTPGTGLGLAVASEILEHHGSKLEVQSTVGEGSRFSFRLSRELMSAPPPLPVRPPNVIARSDDVGPTSASAGLGGSVRGRDDGRRERRRLGDLPPVPRVPADGPAIPPRPGARTPETTAEKVWIDVGRGLHGFSRNEVAFRRWLFDLARRSLEDGDGAVDAVIEVDVVAEETEQGAGAVRLLDEDALRLPPETEEPTIAEVG